LKETLEAIQIADRESYIDTYSKSAKYLFVSGKDDPFGHYGRDIEILKDKFAATGLDVSAYLFEGYRHEVLNEGAKYDIYDLIIEWMINNESKNHCLSWTNGSTEDRPFYRYRKKV